jgi:replicative DNA helicase
LVISLQENQFKTSDHNESVLLSIIINSGSSELFYHVFDKIELDDFINPFHKEIYQILIKCTIYDSLKIEKELILSKLDPNFKNSFDELINLKQTSDNIDFYLDQVKNYSRLNILNETLISNLNKINEIDANAIEIISSVESDLLKVVNSHSSSFKSPKELMPILIEKMKKNETFGVETSFKSLDNLTNGIEGLALIAARPSCGKSQLASHICVYNALKGVRSALFSLEMNDLSLMRRIISNVTEISGKRLRSNTLTIEEIQTLEYSISTLESLPLLIDQAGGLTVDEICAKARRLKIKYPDLAFIVIDYLQLIQSKADNRTDDSRMGKISGALKNLSNSLNIPVIALSQLNRSCESRENKRPLLSDLRTSGNLEQDADLVMFLYGDWYYDKSIKNRITELILAKNRNGEVGTILLDNDQDCQKFRELSN